MQYAYDIINLFVVACQYGPIGNLDCFDTATEKRT